MNTNDPGREPEPTDAAEQAIEVLRERFEAWYAKESKDYLPGHGKECDAAMKSMALIAWLSGAFMASGARPMPDTPAPDEVAQLPECAGGYTASDNEGLLRDTERVLKYLRWDGQMAEKHEVRMIGKAVEEYEFTVARKLVREMTLDRKVLAARIADLEADVARLKDALIDRETECIQLHAEMQEPLTAQRLREHNGGYLYLGNGVEVAIAGTTARIADLEAENADLKRMVCAVQPSADHESLYCHDMVFRGVNMNWFDARDKMLSHNARRLAGEGGA